MMKYNPMSPTNDISQLNIKSFPGCHLLPRSILLCRLLFLFLLLTTGGNIIAQDDTTLSDDYWDKILDNTEPETVDDDSAFFDEKWGADTLVLQNRTVPRDIFQSQKNSKAFWYADKSFVEEVVKVEEKGPRYKPLWDRTWFQTLLWLLIIGGFATAIAMYLANKNVSLFRKKTSRYQDESEDFIPEDIFSINYQKEIDKAVAAGNYRLAIRLMYLRLLKAFADKSIIKYQQDKTNFDYLLELQQTSYYQHFFRVTRHYEYSWYGKFDVSQDNFERIRKEFNKLESSIY